MNSLKETLSSLPPTLDETYYLILQRITKAKKPRVYHVLQWLCFSFRPLEGADVLNIYQIGDSIQPPFTQGDTLFRPAGILAICHGLLVMVRCLPIDVPDWSPSGREYIELAHFSVKEYLLSTRALSWRFDSIPSHIYILQSSIAFFIHAVRGLNHDSPQIGRNLQLTKSLMFLPSYMGTWIKAYLDCLTIRDHPDLQESFCLVLHPGSILLASFFGCLVLKEPDTWFVHEIHFAPVHSLAAAAALGLSVTVKWLLGFYNVRSQIDMGTPAEMGATPLVWAVVSRQIDIVEVLLEAGADINCICANGDGVGRRYGLLKNGNALLEAVRTGQKQVVQVLLDAGADVNQASFVDSNVSLSYM
jgi:hypothetical protein